METTMHSPLIVEPHDPKWLLLQKVLAVVSTRRTKQELSKKGITPVASAEQAIKIALVAMFFSVDIAFVVQEMRTRKKLRRFIGIPDNVSVDTIYRFFSKCDEAQFVSVISGILNSCCTHRRKRGNMTFLIDATAITLDLNWFRRTFSKKQLEKREFKWGYSPSHGHYIGYKLTLVIEYPSLHPVCILLHPGSPHDSVLYEEIMTDLKRRRIIRIGDLVVFDKGYYSYGNYVNGIFKFNVVPLIFSKKNFSVKKLMNHLNYPIWIFGRSDTKLLMVRFRSLASRLINHLRSISPFMEKRSLIEDVFKTAKNAFSLRKIHRYTSRSVAKTVCLNVLLLGLVISLGFDKKVDLQRLSEW
ncbi:MAG TPA: transposase [Methanoregulaceae archaeon]|nr:transposase [Methanoregulaceae archaeon]